MEYNVSPLLNPIEPSGLQPKPYHDDPYAFVTSIDQVTRHDYYYIARKIEQGWITERDIEIVKFILVHRWVTLSQIGRLFFPDAEREATVRNRVKKLLKYGLLRKIQWSSQTNVTENRPSLYELGASGADILKYRFNMFIGQRDPRSMKPTTMLYRFKYVIANELFSQLLKDFQLGHFEYHPLYQIEEETLITTANFSLKTPKGKSIKFTLLCYRDDEKWLKTLRYQAASFKRYLNKSNEIITLVLLVSTQEKANMAAKILEQEGLSDTWFICDEDILNPDKPLKQSFFAIQHKTKMYYDLG